MIKELRELGLSGCGDNSCFFEKSKGMSTNGGCRCRPHTWHMAVNKYRGEINRLEVENADLKDAWNKQGRALIKRKRKITELEAENAALVKAAKAVVAATDEARKQYGSVLSFRATTAIDNLAALLQSEGEI